MIVLVWIDWNTIDFFHGKVADLIFIVIEEAVYRRDGYNSRIQNSMCLSLRAKTGTRVFMAIRAVFGEKHSAMHDYELFSGFSAGFVFIMMARIRKAELFVGSKN